MNEELNKTVVKVAFDARVNDLHGDVTPLQLRLKYDLKGLILKKYDRDDVLNTASRKR